MLSDVDNNSGSKGSGMIALVGVVAVGAAIWKFADYFETKRANEATDKANKNIIKSTVDTIKTKERIQNIESKAFVTGVNSFGKKTTVNVINLVKEAINSFFVVLKDANGVDKYIRKANPDAAEIKDAIFSAPVSTLAKFQKLFSIYTGENLLTAAQRLDPKTYQSIKAVYEVAYKKYPTTFK